MTVDIRKIVVCAEETRHDGGPALATPVRKAWAAAAVKNPYAGRYEPDIMPMMEALKPLGLELSRRLVVPVAYVDERFTSVQAQQAVRSAGLPRSERERKDRVDRAAAALLLQRWLDRRAPEVP